MCSVTAVAFDLDNTLIDRDAAFRRLITDWVGDRQNLIDRILEIDEHGHGSRDDLFQTLAEVILNNETPAELWSRFRKEFPSYFKPEFEVYEMLGRLENEGFNLGILSNGGGDLQRGKLEYTRLNACFDPDRILISEEIGIAKPHPGAFEKLIERLQTHPENILFVGDHPETDILAASDCGLQTCWIRNGSSEIISDYSIAHLSELESLCLSTI